MKFTNPKGTRDFYPEDMALQNRLFTVWRDTARLYGFEEYEGPIFEHLEVFTAKSGDEIVKQLYHFKDKSDRDLALRPEITPTLARLVAAKGQSLKKPVKWFSIPRLFRYERMQRGRLREFFQYNLDIVGEPSISAEAEIVAAAVQLLKKLGLAPSDFKVCVNSRKLMKAALEALSITGEKLDKAYAILDRRAKLEPETLSAMYRDAAFSDAETASIEAIFSLKTLPAIRERFPESADVEAAADELDAFFSRMDAYGAADSVVFDTSIVRGLAYYTGIVFEIYDAGRTLRAVAGGGRYDNLIQLFGGEPTPAVGFGMGDAVITELLQERGLLVPYAKAVTVYVINFDKQNDSPAVEICAFLRAHDIDAEFSLRPQNLKKQFEAAQCARYAVFTGGDEWLKGEVKVKDLKSGAEKTLARTAFESGVRQTGRRFLDDLFAESRFG